MAETGTPFSVVRAVAEVRRAPKDELLRRVRRMERATADGPAPETALACLQDARFLDDSTLSAYAQIATRGTQVVLYARGLRSWLADGVRGVDLDDEDALGDQWTVVVCGQASSSCFAAQDLLEPAGSDDERTFEWAQTDDPAVCALVRDALLARVPDLRPSSSPAG